MRLEIMTEEYLINEHIRRQQCFSIDHIDNLFQLRRLLEEDKDNTYTLTKPKIFWIRGLRIELPVHTVVFKEGEGMVFKHHRHDPFRIYRRKVNSPQLRWVFNPDHAFCMRRYKRRPTNRSRRG